jgi:hypothetical protein
MDIWLNAVRAAQAQAAENPAFITTWKTDNAGPSADNQITIPLVSVVTYNFVVDWGDGTQDTITAWDQAELTHTYAAIGTYTVTITGTCPRIYFNNGGDKLKITAINNWGDVAWGSTQNNAFYGCANLTALPSDHLDFWNTTLTAAFRMFNSSALAALPNGMTLAALTLGADMFRGNSLTAISDSMTLAALTNGSDMFRGNSLTAISDSMTLAALTNGSDMFFGNTISTEDYSNLLINTEAANSNNSVTFHGGNSKYNTAGGVARNALITNQSWTITDGGPE